MLRSLVPARFRRILREQSRERCADHILQFFQDGGTYNAIDAAHSELLSAEVTLAEYREYMSVYPPGTELVVEYAKLQGNSTIFNSKSLQVTAIKNSLKGKTFKMGPKLLSITTLSPIQEVDKKLIEVDLEDDNEDDTMSVADSTATSKRNAKKMTTHN